MRNEVVAAVEEEAERLYRLVEDLLAVARHDAGEAPLPARPLLLQHWLPGIVDAEVHAEPRLRVRTAIPPDLPPVVADDAALAQVVRNLLRNAVRYAADGMPVEVVARPPDDGHITLEVLDRGPGVAPAEAGRIFDPFYRSEAAEAFGSGAGLGLAAARSLLQAMGGSIEAAERDGGGARFVVRPARGARGRGRRARLNDTSQRAGAGTYAVRASCASGSMPSSRIAAAPAFGFSEPHRTSPEIAAAAMFGASIPKWARSASRVSLRP